MKKKKEKILDDYKSGKIKKEEARKKIVEEKEKIINSSKKKLEEEKEKIKNENLARLKNIVTEKLNGKLKSIEKLSEENQKKVYTKFIEKLNSQLNKNNLSKNDQIIITLIKEEIINKKNNLD